MRQRGNDTRPSVTISYRDISLVSYSRGPHTNNQGEPTEIFVLAHQWCFVGGTSAWRKTTLLPELPAQARIGCDWGERNTDVVVSAKRPRQNHRCPLSGTRRRDSASC